MLDKLTLDEKINLNKTYRFALSPSDENSHIFQAEDLLDPNKLEELLSQMQEQFGTKYKYAVGSMFSKRYAYLIAVNGLYAMTALRKGLDFSIENTAMKIKNEDEKWLPELVIKDDHATLIKSDEDKIQAATHIFKDHLSVIWEAVSIKAKVAPSILWENTALYIYYLYETKMAEAETDEERELWQSDLDLLLNLDMAAFGVIGCNPLKVYYHPKTHSPTTGQTARVRTTCCFYYILAEDGSCCSTCPKNFINL